MRKSYHKSRESSGYGWIFFLLVLVVGIVVLGWKAFSHEAPVIKLVGSVGGIGKQTVVGFELASENGKRFLRRIFLDSGYSAVSFSE